MRIVLILHLACVGVAMVSAHPARAQNGGNVVLHIHRAGDTVSVRNAPVTIDHTIEAGKTDSAGTLRVRNLEDGGQFIEATADGYLYLYDTFNSGPGIRQPIEIAMYPDAKKPDAENLPADWVFVAIHEKTRPGQAAGAGFFLGRSGYFETAANRRISEAIVFTFAPSFAPAASPSTSFASAVRTAPRAAPLNISASSSFAEIADVSVDPRPLLRTSWSRYDRMTTNAGGNTTRRWVVGL